MNFLAHLHLAEPTPASRIGNILPDLVRGPLPHGLDPQIERAARFHQRVDALTDTHPIFARTRARLRPAHGIYAPILVDLFYDHCLAAAWDCYRDQPLDEFVAEVYAQFDEAFDLMPEAMRPPVRRMIDYDWLSSYATIEGIATALDRMSIHLSHRFKREVDLRPATATLAERREAIAGDFDAFYPDLLIELRR